MGEAYITWIILYCTKALFACVALHGGFLIHQDVKAKALDCTGITFHMHHIVTDKEPVLINIYIQYMKCSLFILIDVICYCLHTKSVIMKFKSDIYIIII